MKRDYRKKYTKYIYSLIYGIFGSLVFFCYFNLMCMATFHERSKYPNRYPMSIGLGFVSLIICIVNFIFNIEALMKEKNRIKYILIEFVFTAIIFVLFLFIIGFIDNEIIKLKVSNR